MQYLTKSEFLSFMQDFAPRELAESFDNVGMLIDAGMSEYKRILFALDLTVDVAQEAADTGCDLVVTHHPILMQGVKRLSVFDGETHAACIMLKHGISHFAAHTNLDSARIGTNSHLCELLRLKNCKSLEPKRIFAKKIAVFVPENDAQKVLNAMCDAGAGEMGNYSHCTFSASGEGTFLPCEGATPHIGSVGMLERVPEIKIETLVKDSALPSVLSAMRMAHPYEEIAYDVYPVELYDDTIGIARMGELPIPMTAHYLCLYIKEILAISTLRTIGDFNKPIKTVALCAGSGASLLDRGISAGADAFLTGDVKHSAALQARAAGIFLIDAGHYETEKPIMSVLIQCLQHRFNRVQYKTEFVLTLRESAAMNTI